LAQQIYDAQVVELQEIKAAGTTGVTERMTTTGVAKVTPTVRHGPTVVARASTGTTRAGGDASFGKKIVDASYCREISAIMQSLNNIRIELESTTIQESDTLILSEVRAGLMEQLRALQAQYNK